MMVKVITGLSNKYFGYILKISALVAKFLFLIVLASNFEQNIYSRYFVLTTSCLLIARVISFGFSVNIALVVKANPKTAIKFIPYLQLLMIMYVFSLLAYLAFDIELATSVGLVICFSSSNLVSGLVRGFNSNIYELNSNSPWLFFVIGVLIYPPTVVEDLLFLYSISFFIAQLLSMRAVRLNLFQAVNFKAIAESLNEIIKTIPTGFVRQVSIINQLVLIRMVFVLPDMLGLSKVSDETALALGVVEGIWQFFMVGVYRRFAMYCRGVMDFQWKNALLTLCLFLIIVPFWHPVLYLAEHIFPLIGDFSSSDFVRANLILAAVLLMADIRYWYWANNRIKIVIFYELASIVLLFTIILLGFYFDFDYALVSGVTLLIVAFLFYLSLIRFGLLSFARS